MILSILLVLIILYSFIIKKNINKNNSKVEYYREIPTSDNPAYVGKIIKGNLDGNDIVATILDLKYKGYIEIKEKTIKGKNRKILCLQKDFNDLMKLEEHELFLINQIFKNSKEVVFDDYVKNQNFKKNFKVFDKMIERQVQKKTIYKNSLIKNINKILLLIIFIIFGITIFYSLLAPITSMIKNVEKNKIITINLFLSGIIYIIIVYKYILYINKSTNIQENINLNIVYIILTIIMGISIIFNVYKVMLYILVTEYEIQYILINFSLAVILILYMFNIIKHTEKEEYIYYIFLIASVISLFFDMKILMCINITFYGTYIFFKSPQNKEIIENDYIYKWLMFKKYIEDYSILAKQEENALLIWDKYLIYAIALGVNKKIVKKYSKLSNNILINDEYIRKFYIEYLE